jgi:hypothetical protein
MRARGVVGRDGRSRAARGLSLGGAGLRLFGGDLCQGGRTGDWGAGRIGRNGSVSWSRHWQRLSWFEL